MQKGVQKVACLFAVLLGAAMGAWTLYNVFVQRMPGVRIIDLLATAFLALILLPAGIVGLRSPNRKRQRR